MGLRKIDWERYGRRLTLTTESVMQANIGMIENVR
jgi:phage tail protein X